MANSFAQDKMLTLWESVTEQASSAMTLSRDLRTWDMNSEANKDRTSDGATADQEWIPQEYRFVTQDGNVSTDNDFQDIIDRNIPVNRSRSKRILAYIDTKGLRDPGRVSRVAEAMAKEIAQTVDIDAYQTLINEASLVMTVDAKFTIDSGIDAETIMLNRGLGGFDRKMFLSNSDYKAVAKELGSAQYDSSRTTDAIERARIPRIATFDTMRSDYLLPLAANDATGLKLAAETNHVVATYNADGFYLDNRSMTAGVTGATSSNMPKGTKFVIAGVNALHPVTRTDTGELQTFTVKSSGAGTVTFQPAIIAEGPFKNCSAKGAAEAAVTILNAKASNPTLFYTPEAAYIVPGRLPVMGKQSGEDGFVESVTANGLPMRMTYRWDFHKERYEMKAVIYYDIQVVQPEMLGAILTGQA